MSGLPTADEAFGPSLADTVPSSNKLPTADEVFGAAPSSAAPSASSRAMEAPRGFNAMAVGALGIPMDTAIAAGNLGKAGIEGGYLLAGKTPPTQFDPDRPGTSNENIPLSSDWLRKKFTQYFGDQTSLQNPKDRVSRYLYAAGAALPAAISRNPRSVSEAVTSATGAGLTGVGGEAGRETAEAMKLGPTGEMVGQMLGQGVTGGVMGRVAQPLRQPDAVRQQAVDTYEGAGIPVDAAQRTGNELLKKVNSGLSDNPLTTSLLKGYKQEQERGTNRLMLRSVGENEEHATQVVMDRARTNITDVMDDVAARTRIPWDRHLEDDLTDIEARIEHEVPDSHKSIFRSQIKDVLQNAADNSTMTPTGPTHWIDGGAYQKITSSLNNMSRLPEAQPIVRDFQEAMMDALQRGAAPEDAVALTRARRMYRNLKQIEPAISKDNEGNISPQLVTNQQATKRNRNQSVYGRGDQELVDSARSARLLSADLPNSGTPSRFAAMALPGALGAGAGALLGHHTGEMGLGTGLGMLASQYGTLALMHSPRVGRYLAHGVPNPYIRGVLEAPSQAPYRQTIPLQALINKYDESGTE